MKSKGEGSLNSFYESEKFWSENCWETCGGSHCCKLSKFSDSLQFAPKDSQFLHLFEFEVKWLEENNQLDPEFKKTLKKYEFDYKDKKLVYYSVQCGYEGLCPNHKYRPIMCFLYPYLPYFSKDKKVETLSNLSVYDDMYDSSKEDKPCTLWDKFSVDLYNDLASKYFNFNEFYFYTNAYVKLKDKMVENFNKVQSTTKVQDALQQFEMAYVLKRLISKDEVNVILDEEFSKFPF